MFPLGAGMLIVVLGGVALAGVVTFTKFVEIMSTTVLMMFCPRIAASRTTFGILHSRQWDSRRQWRVLEGL